jgi:hypothetical protein
VEGLGVPTIAGQPDFAIPNGLLYHGIEVKAPTSERGIENVVKKADVQLGRLSGGGLVVIDLSVIVAKRLDPNQGPLRFMPDEIQERIEAEMQALKERVRSLVLRRTSWERGRGVTASVIVTRVIHWHIINGYAVPGSALAAAWRRYYRTRGSLAFWRATWLGDIIEASLRARVPDLKIRWDDDGRT